MKSVLAVAALAALCSLPRQASAAELRILEPADRTVLRGMVNFRIQPVQDRTEQYFSDPDVIVQDEEGNEVQKLIAILDRKTGICSAALDTRKLKDGVCLVTVKYRTLFQARVPKSTEENLTYGIRNGAAKPGRIVITAPAKPLSGDDTGDITVKVYNSKGKLMPGVRVTFKVDKGDVDTDAEITDSDGEAFVGVDTDKAETVTLTITVEGLPPVTKSLTFVD